MVGEYFKHIASWIPQIEIKFQLVTTIDVGVGE